MAGPHLYRGGQCLVLTRDSQLLKGNRGKMEDSLQVSGSRLVCCLLPCGGGLGRTLDRWKAIHQCAIYYVRTLWGFGDRRIRRLPNALPPRGEEGLDVQK